MTMIGLDVTHQALLAPDVERGSAQRARRRLRRRADRVLQRYHRETYGWDGAPIHDAVAVAHVIRPASSRRELRNVEVELESELCRGRTVVDLWQRTDATGTPHVGVDLDARRSSTSSSSGSRRLGRLAWPTS